MNTTKMLIPSNKVRDIERYCHAELDKMYGAGEVTMFVRMLFEAFLGWGPVRLLTSKEETVNQSDLLRFHWAVEDLKRHRPIQYIIGWTEFCGCRIAVDESTLIPRPETEEIVNRIHERLSDKAPQRVVDFCTGSGCIAIALAKRWPDADVFGVDISEPALQKARENALQNHVAVQFVQADILKDTDWREVLPHPCDLIVSNPPYVMEQERDAMQRNVLDWEPETALFVPDTEPLVFYKSLAKTGKMLLAPGGTFVAEINERLGNETLHLIKAAGFEGEVEKDFRGKARTVWAKKRLAF